MNPQSKTVLITGANGGIGSALVRAFLAVGAGKVYACARDTETLKGMFNDKRVHPVKLDITKKEQIMSAVKECADTQILINNAGVAAGGLIGNDEQSRTEMEINYFGTRSMCYAFSPVLKHNGGGCIINIMSVLSFVNMPSIGSYCASKGSSSFNNSWSKRNTERTGNKGCRCLSRSCKNTRDRRIADAYGRCG